MAATVRVLMVSKAMVVGTYQRKLECLGRLPGIELTVVVPPEWREASRTLVYEPTFLQGYQTKILPMVFNGHFHTHFYRGLCALAREIRPDIVHIDEEPTDVVSWQCLRAAGAAKVIFFTWQNLYRRVPPPFSLIQTQVFRRSTLALCGSAEAQHVLERKGFRGETVILPQVVVDEDLFAPLPGMDMSATPFIIGAASRLVREKGIDLLIRAAAGLYGDWRLEIAGAGPELPALRGIAVELGVRDRVVFLGQQPSTVLPSLYARWSVAALPSRTRPNWKEQFGRAALEAMSCGVPVVVSRCGALPEVVGEAGLIVPEDDVDALRGTLQRLLDSPQLRTRLGTAGRNRVLSSFTQQRLAEQTRDVYERVQCHTPAP